MNKIKRWWNTPVTWGASFKAAFVVGLIGGLFQLIWFFILYGTELGTWIEETSKAIGMCFKDTLKQIKAKF